MYIKGHDFPMDLMERVFRASRAFFESYGVEEKRASFPWDQVKMQGYVGPNEQKLTVLSEDQDQLVGGGEGGNARLC